MVEGRTLVFNAALGKLAPTSEEKQDWLVQLSGGFCNDSLLSGLVTPDEGELVSRETSGARVKFLRGGLIHYGLGLVKAIQIEVGVRQILIGVAVFGIEAHGLGSVFQRLIELTKVPIAKGKIVPRQGFAGIRALPLLVDLDDLVRSARNFVVVVTFDIEPLVFAGPVFQVEGFPNSFFPLAVLANNSRSDS